MASKGHKPASAAAVHTTSEENNIPVTSGAQQEQEPWNALGDRMEKMFEKLATLVLSRQPLAHTSTEILTSIPYNSAVRRNSSSINSGYCSFVGNFEVNVSSCANLLNLTTHCSSLHTSILYSFSRIRGTYLRTSESQLLCCAILLPEPPYAAFLTIAWRKLCGLTAPFYVDLQH
jgi:magnesium-transporting ATPase (P-type)